MKPYAKLYVSSENEKGIFGNGKYQLLKAVQQHRSISKAANSLQRSYRKAWGDIKKAESALGQQLVKKVRGGRFGGQTELTEYCEKVLKAWEIYRENVNTAMNTSFNKNLKCLYEQPKKMKKNISTGKA